MKKNPYDPEIGLTLALAILGTYPSKKHRILTPSEILKINKRKEIEAWNAEVDRKANSKETK